MNLFTISGSYIRSNLLSTFLTILLLAFGVGIIVVLLLVVQQTEENYTRNVQGINMVVGAKGSPLQLILASVYHIDYPTGNISAEDAEKIIRHPLVKEAIPLGLGDSHKGFRIVGTDERYPAHYNCQLAQGQWWKNNFEVVIGSKVARQLGLKVGDNFHGGHGLVEGGGEHEEHPYKVVGIMQPSQAVPDRLILTSLQSIWAIHATHDQVAEQQHTGASPSGDITSLLIKYKSPIAAVMLPRQVNSIGNLQAAMPANEISRLFNLIGVGADILSFFACAIIGISLLSMFVVLYNALKERRYDIAIMRTLGASAGRVFLLIISEGVLLALLGAIAGLVLGHAAVAAFSGFYQDVNGEDLSALRFLPEEAALVALSLAVGAAAALFPAIQAYKIDISSVLARQK